MHYFIITVIIILMHLNLYHIRSLCVGVRPTSFFSRTHSLSHRGLCRELNLIHPHALSRCTENQFQAIFLCENFSFFIIIMILTLFASKRWLTIVTHNRSGSLKTEWMETQRKKIQHRTRTVVERLVLMKFQTKIFKLCAAQKRTSLINTQFFLCPCLFCNKKEAPAKLSYKSINSVASASGLHRIHFFFHL